MIMSVKNSTRIVMAGTAGFEPTHDGIKTRCLTAWRRPNDRYYLCLRINIECKDKNYITIKFARVKDSLLKEYHFTFCAPIAGQWL